MNCLYLTFKIWFLQLAFLPKFSDRHIALASPLAAPSNLPYYCQQLCGQKRRRDGQQNWSSDFKICTCWDSPAEDHFPNPAPRGCHKSLDSDKFYLPSITLTVGCRVICDFYLQESIGGDTTVIVHDTFSCLAPKGYTGSSLDGKLFCLCDFTYSSNIVNFVSITDSIENDYGYKVKIID